MSVELRPEEGIAGKFVKTAFDENGVLSKIEFTNDESFNFAYDVVDALAEKTPDKRALIHISREKAEKIFTFKEIKEYSNQAANYYKSLGINKGDKVLFVLKRHYQFWISILALHKIGAIAIPASNILKVTDYKYRIEAADVKAVVCTSDDNIPAAMEEADADGKVIKVIVNGAREGWHNFDEDIKGFSPVFDRPTGADATKAHEPSIMLFTSGTTEHPKMVAHNYLYPLGHYITAKYWHCNRPDGVHLTVSDTGWGKALWGKIYGQWLCETTIFVYDFDAFDADSIFKLIEKYKITTFCAPPTMYRILIRMDLSKYDLSSCKYFTTAGEALNPEVFYKFKEQTGFTIYEGFGQTETTLSIGNLENTTPRPGSMGKASPLYDVKIMKPDGTLAAPNETGEIVFDISKGEPDGLFMEYYKDPERTAEVKKDGYYHTGDTAYMDEDGYFWFVGRVDDIIKVAGYRVGPFEIENEIMKIPYVLECAVTSVPDSTRGQAIKATIVLTEGTVGDEKLKRELKKYFRENIASYKRPRVIEFIKEMPKTTSSKIRRVEIRENDWKEQ
jgi:acetyl-CoA synthetase